MRLFTGSSISGVILAAGVFLALSPNVSRAEIINEEEVGRFILNIGVGYQGTAMSDFNSSIHVVNYFLETNQGLRTADDLSGSASALGEVRYKFTERFSVGLGVSNTQAKSTFDVTFGAVDFYTRATAWSPMVYYHLPFVQSMESFENVADRMSLYVGAGPVFLTKGLGHMRVIDRTTEPTFRDDGDLIEVDGQGQVRGSGVGIQGLVGASWQLTSFVSFSGEIGYRSAKISNPDIVMAEGFERNVAEDDPDRREPLDQAVIDFFKRENPGPDNRPPGFPLTDIEGNPIPYYSGGPMDLDFSGVQLRVGMRFHLF